MIRAGSAQADITPPLGTHLAGHGAGIRRPGRKVLDPLHARAVAIESNGRRLAVLSLEVMCVTEDHTRAIRAAAKELGFEPEAVMVHAIQNHSAPSVGCMMLDPDFPFPTDPETEYVTGSNETYSRQAVLGAIAALKAAVRKMRPADFACGRGMLSGQAFNRRGVGMDGSIHMPWFYNAKQFPLGPVHLRYIEGPDDPEVGVIAFRSGDLALQAVLLNFSCHPVNLFATRQDVISADWPGAWAAELAKLYPGQCPFTVLNGCCGNLNPWPPMTANFKPDHRRMGRNLADMAGKVMARMKYAPAEKLDWRMRLVPLPYREIPEARRKAVDRLLKRHPRPVWNKDRSAVDTEWFLAASTRSIDFCRKRMPKFLYEVQVFRVGDAFIVALPGEPFVEGQLAIKTQSPLPYVQVAHMCSHYVGYLPTLEGALRGGHEANGHCTYWAKLAPESLDLVVRNVKEMMRELA